jgi:tetratricopeptide (TPR) repeat protein
MQLKFYLAFFLLGISFLGIQSCTEGGTGPVLEAVHGEFTGIPSIDAITKYIKADPNNMVLRMARCEAYTNEGLLKEAETEARKIWETDKTNWKYSVLLAWTYFDNNKSKPAIKTLEQAMEIHPDTIPLLIIHSRLNLNVKHYDEALISAEKVLKISPLNTEGLFMRGLVLKYIGDTINAISDFQTAVENDADYLESYMQLANIFAAKNQKIAIQYYDNALRIDSLAYEALIGKANFYHQNYTPQNGMLEKAKTAFEQAILHHPQESDASFNYGMLYLEEEDYEQAHHFFNIAIQYDLEFGDAYYYKGFAAEKMGNIEAAVNDYNNAIANNHRFKLAQKALKRLGK